MCERSGYVYWRADITGVENSPPEPKENRIACLEERLLAGTFCEDLW